MKYIPHRGIFLIFTLASDPADAEKKNIERGYNTIKMLKNTLQQKLSQRFSPSQIQLMNMLALPTVAFEQYLADELESNPALDEITSAQDDYTQDADNAAEQDTDENDYTPEASSDDFDIQDYMFDDEDPDYVPSSSSSDTSGDRNSFIASQSGQESFTAHLLEQLSLENLSERQMTIGRYIIGNIDSDGYLRTDLMSVSDDLAFTASMDVSTEEIKQVLSVIQSFDPPGVGATSLQQCLSIQLSSMAPSPAVDLAKRIVDEAFDDLGKKNFDRLAEHLGCTRGQLSDAVNEIARLNPKPGNSYSQNTSSPSQLQVTPDFIIRVEDGQVEITLAQGNTPRLKISPEYSGMLARLDRTDGKTRKEKDTAAFIKNKIDSARWFIDAVRQRRNTLMLIMESIVRRQKEYLLSGDVSDLRPLGLKDIASDVGMDISTVSRVVSQKYADTPYGTMSLKNFFSDAAVNEKGEDISTREVKEALREIISSEDKNSPLTDEQLTSILSDKGYRIARRTTAKYRESLGFPTARLRREL